MAKILVIDDSPTVRGFVRTVLESVGHTVVVENTALTLPLLLFREKPDLILLDVSMPLMTGDVSMRKLKAHSLGSTIVLLHSTKPADELQTLAEKCGAHGFIEKVSQPEPLLRAVDAWLSKPRT